MIVPLAQDSHAPDAVAPDAVTQDLVAPDSAVSGPATKVPQSIWPRVPPRFTAGALAGHSAVALAVGALLYLVCLTGAVSVFVDELRLAEQPTPTPAALAPGVLNRAAAEAVAASGPGAVLYLLAPQTPRQRLTVERFGGGGARQWVADASGDLRPQRTPFTDFVTELHMTLTLPGPWGSLLVGASGAALLSLIVSGVLSHPRLFRDAFRLRLSGSRRLREAELHNRLSVWGLPFHVAVTLTGAFFGLTNLVAMAAAAIAFGGDTAKVYAPVTSPAVHADARPAPPSDIEALVARAQAQRPGAGLEYVGLEGAGTQGVRIAVQLSAPARLTRGDQIVFDGRGRRVGAVDFASGDPGVQAYSMAANVHFGFFGGLPVRLAYAVLGLALTYVCATGISIWLARRRARGRPAPRLEWAWSAWTWGAPLALIAAALLSRWAPPGPCFWSLVALCQVAAQLAALSGGALRSR